MKEARISHVLFCVFAALVFAAAAWDARTFQTTSRYFPQFAAMAGLAVALIGGAWGTLSILRRRSNPAEPATELAVVAQAEAYLKRPMARAWAMLTDIPESERGQFLAGFMWLAIWAGFVLSVVVLGYIVGSALWLGLWFRIVHRWPFRIVLPVAGAAMVALWAAETYADVHLPGGDGLLLSMLQ